MTKTKQVGERRWTPGARRAAGLRALLGLALLGGSGCGSLVTDSPEAAQVRFVDASVDAPALDVYSSGAGAAYNLGFATSTSYIPLSPGAVQLSAHRAGTGQALVSQRATVAGAHQYTVVVNSRLGSLGTTVYADALPAAQPGMLAVRILNELEGGPVDVYLLPNGSSPAGAVPAVSGLGFTGDGGYLRVPASGSYALALTRAGAGAGSGAAIPVSGARISGEPGAVRTVVLSEAPVGSGKGVYAFVLDDGDGL